MAFFDLESDVTNNEKKTYCEHFIVITYEGLHGFAPIGTRLGRFEDIGIHHWGQSNPQFHYKPFYEE